MDLKIVGSVAASVVAAVILVIGVIVYAISDDTQAVEDKSVPITQVVEEQNKDTLVKKVLTEKAEKKVSLALKEEAKVVQKVIEPEPKLTGFSKAASQEVNEAKLNSSSYTKLYDQDELNIFIDDSLKKKMKKNRMDNTAILILKYIKTATAVIKEDVNGKVYLEISKYKTDINPDNFNILTKLNQGDKLIKSEHVYNFGFDDAKLKKSEGNGKFLANLDSAVKEVDVKNITVVGYTDSQGSKDYNIFLSYKRAHALNSELEKYNIDINYVLRGESNPVASNKTLDGRAKNRRVEIFLGYK